MEQSVPSRVTMKLNMTASYCNNLRLERTRMNYATPLSHDMYASTRCRSGQCRCHHSMQWHTLRHPRGLY
jgi:hypothetical protein